MINTSPQHIDIPIKDIKIEKRRVANPDRVRQLAGSIEDIGLLNRIAVTQNNELIAGLHRVEAYKLRGRETIPAVILDLDDLHAELAEIDENLMRNPLKGLGLGEVLLRRKEISEQLRRSSTHGGDRKSDATKSSRKNSNLIAFADEAAQKMGSSSDTVRLYIKVAKRIPHDLRKQLRDHGVGKKITELETLSRLPESDQHAVVQQLVDGSESVQGAIKAIEKPSAAMKKVLATKEAKNSDTGEQGQSNETHQSGSEPEHSVPSSSTALQDVQEQSPTEDIGADQPAALDTSPDRDDIEESEAVPLASHGADVPSDTQDALTAYRKFLQQLPHLKRSVSGNAERVIGNAMDPREAAGLLKDMIEFMEILHEMEWDLAGKPDEYKLPPRADQPQVTSAA